jgi:hypothetical protein
LHWRFLKSKDRLSGFEGLAGVRLCRLPFVNSVNTAAM